MQKRVIKGGVVLIVIITVLYFGTGQHISDETPDCELMMPLPAEIFANFRDLDFSDKTRLSLRKFGFRKKLVIREDSIVTQEVEGFPDFTDSAVCYGIYRDEKLKEPVEEVDFTWLHRDWDFEEGLIEKVPYDEKKDSIVALEKGTYYAAIYTKNPFEGFTASYRSYICPLNERSKLNENEVKKFYIIKEDQKNTFEINAKKDGSVRIKTDIFDQGTVRIYDESKVLLCKKSGRKNSDKPVTVVFPVEKGQTYYVEIESCGHISIDAAETHLHDVKYTYI